jgi:hypothetical protein
MEGVDELATWDRLMTIQTQKDADDFIDPILSGASPAEFRVVKLAFMGDLLSAAYGKSRPSTRGPRGAEPTISGSHVGGGRAIHPKAYNMMELADSVHDATTRRVKTSRMLGQKRLPSVKERLEYIHHCVGPSTLPTVSVRYSVKLADWEAVSPGQYKYELKRRQMTLNDVHVWDDFLEIMTTNQTLEFPGEKEPVPNPLCGKNFTEGMFSFDKNLTVSFEEQYAAYLAGCVRIAEGDVTPDLGVYNIIDGSYARAVGGSVYVDMLKEWMKSMNPGLSDVMSPYVDARLKLMSVGPLTKGDIVNVEVWCTTNDRQIIQLSQLADLSRNMRLMFGSDARFMPDSGAMIIQLLTGIRFCYKSFKRNFEVDSNDAAEYLPPGSSGPMTEQLLRESLSKIRNSIDVNWSSWYCDGSLIDSKEPLKDLKFSNKKTGDVFHEGSVVKVKLGHATPATYKYAVSSPALGIPETEFDAVLRPTGEFDATGVRPLYAWFVGDDEIDNSSTAAAIAVEEGASEWIAAGKPTEGHRLVAIDLTMKRVGDWAMIRHCKNEGMVFCTVDRFAALCAVMLDVDVLFLKIQQHPTLVQYSFALHSVDHALPATGGGSKHLVPTCIALLSVIVAMAAL